MHRSGLHNCASPRASRVAWWKVPIRMEWRFVKGAGSVEKCQRQDAVKEGHQGHAECVEEEKVTDDKSVVETPQERYERYSQRTMDEVSKKKKSIRPRTLATLAPWNTQCSRCTCRPSTLCRWTYWTHDEGHQWHSAQTRSKVGASLRSQRHRWDAQTGTTDQWVWGLIYGRNWWRVQSVWWAVSRNHSASFWMRFFSKRLENNWAQLLWDISWMSTDVAMWQPTVKRLKVEAGWMDLTYPHPHI